MALQETVQQIKDQALALRSQLTEQADSIKNQAETLSAQLKEQAEGLSGLATSQLESVKDQVEGLAGKLTSQAEALRDTSAGTVQAATSELNKGISNLLSYQSTAMQANYEALLERVETAKSAGGVKPAVEAQVALWPETKERQLAYLNQTLEMLKETVDAVTEVLKGTKKKTVA